MILFLLSIPDCSSVKFSSEAHLKQLQVPEAIAGSADKANRMIYLHFFQIFMSPIRDQTQSLWDGGPAL